jgi:hypothetical protein
MGGIVMSLASYHTQAIATPRTAFERLELARELFQKFHTLCFWNSPHDLDFTEEEISFVVKGLRTYGGHVGFKLAGKLRSSALGRDHLECR